MTGAVALDFGDPEGGGGLGNAGTAMASVPEAAVGRWESRSPVCRAGPWFGPAGGARAYQGHAESDFGGFVARAAHGYHDARTLRGDRGAVLGEPRFQQTLYHDNWRYSDIDAEVAQVRFIFLRWSGS